MLRVRHHDQASTYCTTQAQPSRSWAESKTVITGMMLATPRMSYNATDLHLATYFSHVITSPRLWHLRWNPATFGESLRGGLTPTTFYGILCNQYSTCLKPRWTGVVGLGGSVGITAGDLAGNREKGPNKRASIFVDTVLKPLCVSEVFRIFPYHASLYNPSDLLSSYLQLKIFCYYIV